MAASPSDPNDPSIIVSRVFQALQAAMDLARRDSRLVYFPWHSAKEQKLRDIARQLKLIFLSAQPDIPNPENARGLRAVIDELNETGQCSTSLEQAHKALGEWPETEELLRAAVDRINAATRQAQGALLFCPRSMPSVDEWIAKAVRLARDGMKLPVVVVASSVRPALERIRSTDITWEDYRSDVNTFFEQWQRAEAEAEQAKPAPVEPERRERKRKSKEKHYRLCRGFISFLHDLVWQDSSAPAGAAPVDSASGSVDDPRWSALVARLSFPDTSRALAIFEEWAEYELEEGPLPPDVIVRRGRERFLTLLRDLNKEAYSAACHDLDGADQLYKIHLVLCGGAHRESLLAGALLPFWQQRFDDALFRELFLDCFGSSGHEHPLVQRFESRTQLSKHLRRHATGAECNVLDDPAEQAREQFRRWVDGVAKAFATISEFEQQREQNPEEDPQDAEDTAAPAELRSSFISVLEAVKKAAPQSDAGDSLEFAQMLMSGLELFSGLDDEESRSLTAQIEPVATRLIKSALARSQGAVRFEATLLQARQLATMGRLLDATAVLRELRRTHHDSFRTVAIEVEEAHVLERRRDYIGASRAYLQALKQAELISADELSARAVLGQLRCDIAGRSTKDDAAEARRAQRLRAQAMVQIQQARAPELVAISPDRVPRVFVSYRSDSRPVSNRCAKELTGDRFVAWNDQRIRRCEDFSPAIHRELLNSSAILLVLGPTFFDSPWCTHELHFALGQNDLRGLPIFWLWCEPETGDSGKRPISTVISVWQQKWLPQQQYPDYQRAHLQDRLNRVMSKGICLSQTVVSYQPPGNVNPEGAFSADEKDIENLLAPVKELLSRSQALV